MTTPALLAVPFTPPLQNPVPGLFGAVTWTESEDGDERWLASGVEVRPANYTSDQQSGVWGAPWCGDPGVEVKSGDRPDDVFLDPFEALTVWAWDHQPCRNAMSVDPQSRQEVRDRAAQALRLQAPKQVELAFAARVLADVGEPDTASDIVGAVALLEDRFAQAGLTGLIHVSPIWAASLVQAQLISRAGGVMKSPMGHQIVLGAGYSQGLGDTIVGTGPLFGWRGQAVLLDDFNPELAEYVALAEQSLVVGYEQVVGAVTVGVGG